MEEAKKEPTQDNSNTSATAASFIPTEGAAGAEKVEDEAQYQNNQIREYLRSFPPGYRFKPLDEELIYYYLQPKIDNLELPLNKIIDENIYKYHPQDLAEEYEKDGEAEKELYFFSSRVKKYPNGSRPNRLARDGYWKATGIDKPITREGKKIGTKKALVFYAGKPNNGVKTSWIMHEYRVASGEEEKRKAKLIGARDMQLDKWVLCRIHKKKDGCSVADNSPKRAGEHEDDFQEDRKCKGKAAADSNSLDSEGEADEGTISGYLDLDMMAQINNQPLLITEGTHNMMAQTNNQHLLIREGTHNMTSGGMGRNPNMGMGGEMGMRGRGAGIIRNMIMRGAGGIGTCQNRGVVGIGGTGTSQHMGVGGGAGGIGTSQSMGMGVGETGTGQNIGMGGGSERIGTNQNIGMRAEEGINSNMGMDMRGFRQYSGGQYFQTEFLQGPNQYNDTMQQYTFSPQEYSVEDYFAPFPIESVEGTLASEGTYEQESHLTNRGPLPPY